MDNVAGKQRLVYKQVMRLVNKGKFKNIELEKLTMISS